MTKTEIAIATISSFLCAYYFRSSPTLLCIFIVIGLFPVLVYGSIYFLEKISDKGIEYLGSFGIVLLLFWIVSTGGIGALILLVLLAILNKRSY
jgi:hypothetical protein